MIAHLLAVRDFSLVPSGWNLFDISEVEGPARQQSFRWSGVRIATTEFVHWDPVVSIATKDLRYNRGYYTHPKEKEGNHACITLV